LSKLTFEWDKKKANTNLYKHGVSFEIAGQVFGDQHSITIFDEISSNKEERYATIGMTTYGLLVVVVHTDRANRIRIISARKANKTEKKHYEEGI